MVTCSLGGTANGLLLPSVSLLQFLWPFSRKQLLLRWIVDIVKEMTLSTVVYAVRSALRKLGSFCEYRSTDDVKQKKQKTENKTTPNKT